jgi:sodium transport system permease protein
MVTAPDTPRPSREALFRLGRLARKELVEIFRDRRTVITLVLMPLLLYPLLSVAFQQLFLASAIDPNRGQVYWFGFASERDKQTFQDLLNIKAAAPEAKDESARPRIEPVVDSDLDKLVRDGKVDLAVRLKNAEGFALPLRRDRVLDCEIFFVSNNPAALGALTYVDRKLAALNERSLESRLHLREARPKVALLRVTRNPLAVTGGDSMISLAALVPLILILMTITGAVYPAIDLTAGERERGTLEILVAAPVPRLGLLFAKYVSVFSVAVLTALVNLVAMTLTLVFTGLSQALFPDGGLSALLVLQLFGLLLLFAAFFSAVLLSLTSFARSFKEAQAYLIPLMLASLGPGLIGMIPGLELEGPLAAAPLVNIVLLARDLVKGGADPAWGLVVVLTTLAYAAAAIALAARVFGAEGVLYNEQTGWSDLFRRPEEPQPVGTASGALWCLVLMIPTYFALNWLVMLPAPSLPHYWQYFAVGIVGLVLFGLIPALSAALGRVRAATGFGLMPARPAAVVGGLVLGLSLWPLVLQLLTYLLAHRSEQLKSLLQSQNLGTDRAILVGVLVIQAILEEFYFRGYLFGALRNQVSGVFTVILTALLFGLLHVVLGGALGWERLLPSALLGLVLGWVRLTSDSVWPCMLLHACHNAILITRSDMTELPRSWLLGGVVGTVIGTALVLLGRRGATTLYQRA